MAKARYYKADGKKGRARPLPESLFDEVVNGAVLHRVVKAHLANQRQGTAAAKNRSAVEGGTRKPWRQKGTGRARQGSTRSPQWVGGGRAFPPQPHSWRERVPKKVKALARRSALSARAEDDRVIVIDALEFDAPKTRALVKYLETIEANGKVLLLTDGIKDQVVLSARNVQEIRVRSFGTESTYDILWARNVVIERGALDRLMAEEKAAEVDESVEVEDAVAPSEAEEGSDA
jgi:large subunit ribosomal protein L4